MQKEFIDFLRFCLHDDMALPSSAGSIDWLQLLEFGRKQSIVGILFHGIKRLTADGPHPNARQLAQWGLENSSIIDGNKQVYADAYKATLFLYRQFGHRSCVLKGQGNAIMYPDPYMRTPGDIDLWVAPNEGESIGDLMRLCRAIDGDCKLEYHHAELQFPVDTEVELHYRPSFTENLLYNHRLQDYFQRECNEQMKRIVDLPDQLGQICVPTDSFNRIFQLSHIMKHFLFEGIGLRHIIDYYYLLLHKADDNAKAEFRREAKHLGLWKFASGMMYVLQHYLGLADEYLIARPNRRIGRFIMQEVLQTGNFGFSDNRFSGMHSDTPLLKAIYSVAKGFRFILEFPAEALLGHLTWILWWHFYYRRKIPALLNSTEEYKNKNS